MDLYGGADTDAQLRVHEVGILAHTPHALHTYLSASSLLTHASHSSHYCPCGAPGWPLLPLVDDEPVPELEP